jgi:hypothetical protein
MNVYSWALQATLKDDSVKHEQTEKRHKSQPHI